jgi:Lrp/AsnC family transcriptional regulator, leucine-responsive regulatory protein
MIDEIDYKILKILQDKARIPNVEVARQIGMAPSAVLERIRKLENQGFIDGYEVRLNPDRFGRSLVAFVFVTVRAHPADESFGDNVAQLAEVQEVHYIAGEDGYMLKVRVAGTEELGCLVRDVIGGMAGVTGTRTRIVMATIKETSRIPLDALQPIDPVS